MGVLTTLRRVFSRSKITIAGGSVIPSGQFFMTALQRSLQSMGDLSDPYSQSPWVYAAVSSKAENLCGIPYRMMTGTKADEDGKPLARPHPFERLIARPNPFVTSFGELVEAWSISMDLFGEAFWVVLGPSSIYQRGQIPTEFIQVRPDEMALGPDDIDKRSGMILGWTYTPAGIGEQFKLPYSAVLQWKLHNPRDRYRGLAPIAAAMLGIEAEFGASQVDVALMQNGCDPGGTLEFPDAGPDKAEQDALRAAWNDKFRGAINKGKLAILTHGAKYVPIPFSAKDMALPQLRAWQRDAIKAVLKVTDHEFGLVDETTYASSVASKAWLWHNSLIPRLNRLTSGLWAGVFEGVSSRMSMDVWIDADLTKVDALRAGMGDKLTQAQQMVNLGWTAEQANDALGIGLPKPEGTPVGSGIEIGPAATDGVSIGSGSPSVAIGAPATSSMGVSVKRIRRKSAPPSATARRLATWQERAEYFLAKQLHGWQRRLAEDVRSRFTSLPDLTPQQVEALLGAPEFWASTMREAVAAPMVKIAQGSLKLLEKEIGGFDVIGIDDPQWLKRAAQRTAQMVRVAKEWRASIRDTIIKQITEGRNLYGEALGLEQVPQLAKLLDEKYGGILPSNGMVVARTETAMISNQIRHEAMKAEGITTHEWVASQDQHTRESHRILDGEKRSIGQRFSNGLMYPTEPGGPPEEVIQCRCAAVASASDEEINTWLR